MSKIEKVLGDFSLKLFKGFVLEKDITPSPEVFNDIRSILIVVRHQLGDMLCSVPMLRAIRKNFPQTKITLVTKRSTGFKDIFENNNSPVDNVIEYEYGFENFINTIKIIRGKKPELAIVPSSVIFSATNHLLGYYSQAKYRVGARSKDFEPNKIGYTLNIKNDFLWDSKKVHQIERNLDVIRQIGIFTEENSIKLTVNAEHQKFAGEFYRNNFSDPAKKVIGLHPGAAKDGNIWPQEKFAQLMDLLYNSTGAYFYISEGPADTKCVNELERLLKEKYPHIKYAKYCGEIMNNAANICKTALFVSNDTGIMHLASGFDIPVIGLFGPTKAYEWGPIGSNKASIQASGGVIKNIEITDVFETCIACLSV
ncbi:MAG: glycosyltransferase family 9 protein [Ignavibacteria bacterium]|nr:glycosyltransferase family 9 protein [Ignavibacteria bacterium]